MTKKILHIFHDIRLLFKFTVIFDRGKILRFFPTFPLTNEKQAEALWVITVVTDGHHLPQNL